MSDGSMRLSPPIGAAARPREAHLLSRRRALLRSRTLLLTLPAIALAAALAIVFGLQGNGTPAADAGLRPLLQRADTLITYSELGEWTDTIWAANPGDPADRVELARVDHARGYGISPSLSPDGTRIAYTVLSREGTTELRVLEIATGEHVRLAQGIDLLATPVWSPDGDAVVVRHSDGAQDAAGSAQLLRVDMSGSAATVTSAAAGLYAVDFSPDGSWIYYAVLSAAGTDLARSSASGSGATSTVAHLSDGFARDWRMSGDGTQLAYLAQAGESTGLTIHVLNLANGRTQALAASAGEAQFNPIWERGGGLTVGRVGAAAGAAVSLSVDSARSAPLALPAAASGFDVPLSWSPDGLYLAVRHFAGPSAADPGPSRVVILDTAGERYELSSMSDITIAGWLAASQ